MKAVVLVVDNPWATNHGGTQRTRLFIDALLRLGHDVACVYAGGGSSTPPPERARLSAICVPTMPVGERRLPSSLKRAKRAFLPLPTVAGARSARFAAAVALQAPADLLVVQQLRTAQYRAELPGARLWFDQVDVWSSFLDAEIARRRRVNRYAARSQQLRMRAAERRYATEAAIVTAAGYADAKYLEHLASRPVSWLPNAAAVPDKPSRPPGVRKAGFLANFSFWPNQDALSVLRADWLPRLRELGWTVVIAGHGSEHLVAEEGLEIMGPVGEVSEFYDAVDLTLAPIRLGGGIKVKVLESLLYRRPVIASAQALEGFAPHLRHWAQVVDVVEPRLDFLVNGAPHFASDVRPVLDAFTTDAFVGRVATYL